jgi:tripartite-type tricarboxylate transporter receptor subunit TctC
MHSKQRRHTMIGLAATAAALAGSKVFAQTRALPATIKMIVPLPAGGAVDVFARKLAESMSKSLNTVVVVDNRPGAAGLIGERAVATAPADGSMFLYGHSGLVTAQAMGAKMDLLKDLRPVIKLSSSPHLLVVRGESPYKSLKDLLAAMKSTPGKLNYGSGGPGSPTHLMVEMLEEAVPGIKATHVPFKGAIEAVYALVGGDLDFQFTLPAVATEMIKSGKLRALAISGANRFSGFPDLPTIAEAGVADFRAEPWGGFFLPAKASDALVTAFADAAQAATANAEIAQYMERTGSVKVPKQTPAKFGEEIARELEQQKVLVKKLGMLGS